MATRKQLLEDADVLDGFGRNVAGNVWRGSREVLQSIAARLRRLAEDAAEDAPARYGLVPIKTGGPWSHDSVLPFQNPEEYWEVYRNGKFAWRVQTTIRVHDGFMQFYLACMWRSYGSSVGITIHSPRGWQPTPLTIPEGCYIQTPEGVHRCCDNCAWDRADLACPFECPDNSAHPKWCPKPATRNPAAESERPRDPPSPEPDQLLDVNDVWSIFECQAARGRTPDHGHGNVAALVLLELLSHLHDHGILDETYRRQRFARHASLVSGLVMRRHRCWEGG